MFDRDGVRLVTLTGTGGTGKTRLAVAVAGELEHRVARRHVLRGPADLRSSRPDVVGDRRRGERPGRREAESPEERALQFLADRSAFLVLDNLEQIADADVVVSRLLAEGPGCGSSPPPVGHCTSSTSSSTPWPL